MARLCPNSDGPRWLQTFGSSIRHRRRCMFEEKSCGLRGESLFTSCLSLIFVIRFFTLTCLSVFFIYYSFCLCQLMFHLSFSPVLTAFRLITLFFTPKKLSSVDLIHFLAFLLPCFISFLFQIEIQIYYQGVLSFFSY